MTEMGKYCKAYLLKDLRAYNGWVEKSQDARPEKQEIDGQEVEAIRELTEDSIVYVQENYIVTDGILKDENIIFNDVTPDWIEYCQQSLKFEVPDDELVLPEGA